MEHETLLPSHSVSPGQECDDLDYAYEASPFQSTTQKRCTKAKTTGSRSCIVLCIASVLFGFFGSWLFWMEVLISSNTHTKTIETTCTTPLIRREWRSLSIAERDAYIDAVFCLRTKPSRLNPNQTLYDDFAYVHHRFDEESKFAVLV